MHFPDADEYRKLLKAITDGLQDSCNKQLERIEAMVELPKGKKRKRDEDDDDTMTRFWVDYSCLGDLAEEDLVEEDDDDIPSSPPDSIFRFSNMDYSFLGEEDDDDLSTPPDRIVRFEHMDYSNVKDSEL